MSAEITVHTLVTHLLTFAHELTISRAHVMGGLNGTPAFCQAKKKKKKNQHLYLASRYTKCRSRSLSAGLTHKSGRRYKTYSKTV